VTATVDSIPLIAGSILSKKLATGAPNIHISVKYGRAALMKRREDGLGLARLMASVATAMGRRITVPLIAYDAPLGSALGTALEIKQAIELMQGRGPRDLRQQIVSMGAQIVALVTKDQTREAAGGALERALDSGKVYEKFCSWIAAQGGDRRAVERPELLPIAPVRLDAPAPADGTILDFDGRLAGVLAIELGSGRLTREDRLDHRVGLVLHRKNGDRVTRGEPLFTVHASQDDAAERARDRLSASYRIGEGKAQRTLAEEEVFGIH
jgi:pyrimidine-nucleoside phosphorylase